MPQEIAATLSRITLVFSMLRAFIQPMQSASATHAPVIRGGAGSAIGLQHVAIHGNLALAERLEIEVARNERPIRRWISTVRAVFFAGGRLAAGALRVARGGMPYSA